jgi:autoinducer 2-degrading protein
MICIAVTYTIRPGREDEAAEHFRRLIPASRAEPGCRMYVVHRADDDPRTFFIYEQYDDRAAFDAHRASEHFQQHGRNGIQPLAEKRDAVVGTPLE